MKRLIEKGLMFGNLSEPFSPAPHPYRRGMPPTMVKASR